MPIRITGMNSGLDTESIITELVKAQKTKVEKYQKKQTAHEWKQDAWKELNSKIYKLFNGTLSNMRFDSDYSKKTTDISNPAIASIVTGDSAMNATQELEVSKLATAGYMTGGEITDATADSKLTELGVVSGTVFSVELNNGEKEDITVTDGMTISGFVDELKKSGVEASFDAKNKRLHIAAKGSGEANDFTITSSDTNSLKALGLAVDSTVPSTDPAYKKLAQKTAGSNAEIILNGVTYSGESNTFEINGLTITALQKSEQKVILTTRQDIDGIYDKIKNFLKEYNSLINEMDKLYNADSTKGYEPLTDDEKEEMTDSEIEKWETKIKGSIMRGDSNLSTISSAMKNIMLKGATVNGENVYLSDFGIETLGYFVAEDNEKNAYHINGDEDDTSVSAKENTLKAAIAENPEKVISFFAQLSQNLYTELNNQSKSVDGIRSFGKFYDDKKMQDDYDNYTTKIKEQEKKLTALEDRWYSKFSAMETALAKLQSNQSAVSSMLGGM